jgi:hypothetical protein
VRIELARHDRQRCKVPIISRSYDVVTAQGAAVAGKSMILQLGNFRSEPRLQARRDPPCGFDNVIELLKYGDDP